VLVATLATAADDPPPERVGVGLVLAGGGARGAAHVGVLEVMEELRIPVDFVVGTGTSMGSIVGGLYATGFSPAEIREEMLAVDWSNVLVDKAPRKVQPFRRKEEGRLPLFEMEFGYGKKNGFSSAGGLISDQHMGFLLEAMTLPASGIDDFDDLPIPFRAVAVDLDSGDVVIMGDGDLTSAIRASMAFPGGFSPVERDGKTLVDGGVLMNLPVEVALDAGAERIIAVDVGTPLGVPSKELSSFAVLRRTYSVMSKQGRQAQRELLREDDLLIVPELTGITAFGGFEEVGTAMERGEEAAREQLEQLRAFSVSEEEYAAFLERQRAGIPIHQIQVDHIRIEGLERVSPQQVRRRLQIQPGETVDLETLQEDLDGVYQIGEFQQVGFRLEPEDDETTLVVKAKEKPWGPWYFQIGAAIEANFDGIGNFNGLVLARRPEINRFGAEWRSLLAFGKRDAFFTEFYQPLSYAGSWFVQPRLEYVEQRRDVLLADDSKIEFEEKSRIGHFDFGYNFKNRAQLLVGYVLGESKLRTLAATGADIEADVGGARLNFVLTTSAPMTSTTSSACRTAGLSPSAATR
jgi:NTE family protein